ncbi:MAG: sodium:calcium antiporter [Candidatus Micrarchaeia archaeon]
MDSAINIVKMVGITESFIGSTIIAIGTSLPELSIAIQSTRKRHYDLAIGNIIGSNMANITLILGTAAVIAPLNIKLSVFITALIFAIVANILLFYYVAMARKLEKKDGILFLATYLLFLITIFFLQAQEM